MTWGEIVAAAGVFAVLVVLAVVVGAARVSAALRQADEDLE